MNAVTEVPPPPAIPPADRASYPTSVYDMTPVNIMATTRPGFTTGSIGRKVLFNGHGFLAMAGLINALKIDKDTNIIMNPKITVEHNVPAEVYAGQIVGIKGQSISNELGGNITTNYNQQQTGIDLKVTALISSKDTITLIVEQIISAAENVEAQTIANSPPATINETRTVTRIHMPSDHFLVLSGMSVENKSKEKDSIPCLGALPIIGSSLFATNTGTDTMRVLLLFIRPHVIDTLTEMEQLTHKQQDDLEKAAKPSDVQRTAIDDVKEILNF
jgi:type II secretory pathway component GspD/PulD (secretin)